MTVRGWLLIGTPPNLALPPERFCGYHELLPEAAAFKRGDWIVCGHGVEAVVVVCVDVPL